MIVREVAAGGAVRVNAAFLRAVGIEGGRLAEEALPAWIHPEDRAAMEAALHDGGGQVTARHRTESGDWLKLDFDLRTEGDRAVALGRSEGLTDASSEAGNPRDTMAETLEAMVRVVEQKHPGMKCSVLLVGENNRVSVGAGPSLPPEYNAAVEGLAIGPLVGSCGTAAYWNVPVIVEDILTDPLWRDLAVHARAAGLQCCWSHPITSRSGKVLGALALYDGTPRAPTLEELDGLESAATMVGLAVERVLAEAEALAEGRLLAAVTSVVTSFVNAGDWEASCDLVVRAARELTESAIGLLVAVGHDRVRVVSRGALTSEGCELNGNGALILEEVRSLSRDTGPVIDDAPGPQAHARHLLLTGSGDLEASLVTPIRHRDEIVALLYLANPARPYGRADLRSAASLCASAAALFDRKEREVREAQLEAQLQQAEKMEALGVLAGGVAHDFNNMLAVVLGNAELAIDALEGAHEIEPLLREIATAASRATGLCNQMLAYAGQGTRSSEHFEFNALVGEIAEWLRLRLPGKVELALELADRELWLRADATQMRQVVRNLVTNASEALQGGAGRIGLFTDVLDVEMPSDLEPSGFHGRLTTGPYVRLRVADSGRGMSEEEQSRIFDPFFTTKFTGRGLGLAAAKGIINGHRGAIAIRSQAGVGTEFTVLLPLCEAPSPAEGSPETTAAEPRHHRLLVVDDDTAVRHVLERSLRRAGFDVETAADGHEALDTFARDPDAFDCILLDLSMPKLDGEATFREIRRLRPQARVILSSGHTEREILDRFEGAGLAGVLQKPARRDVLIAKIRSVLGDAPPRDAEHGAEEA